MYLRGGNPGRLLLRSGLSSQGCLGETPQPALVRVTPAASHGWGFRLLATPTPTRRAARRVVQATGGTMRDPLVSHARLESHGLAPFAFEEIRNDFSVWPLSCASPTSVAQLSCRKEAAISYPGTKRST